MASAECVSSEHIDQFLYSSSIKPQDLPYGISTQYSCFEQEIDTLEEWCDASPADPFLSWGFSNNIIFDEKCGTADFKSTWKKELVWIIWLPREEDFQTVKNFQCFIQVLSSFWISRFQGGKHFWDLERQNNPLIL